ncbi:DUF3231 family protein [Cohnella sp.]|uniref:DUF3231 family protein n=1 Tax=Cohnella sp. TaxID=1883426 RepID=UPI0035666DFA
MPTLSGILEATSSVIKSLSDGEKPPLHVGEVMSCWTYLAFIQDIINYESVALNTTTDKELTELCQEALKITQSHEKLIKDFMGKEGIPLPDGPQIKPKSDPNAIPMGAKFTDKELANAVAINLAYAASICANSAIQSLRSDVGLMFFKFQADKMMFGTTVKTLMEKRGWLKKPPYFYQSGLPAQSENSL